MNNKYGIKKILIFDIWSNYAHFRKFYTTTSPLTFPVPPKTALYGMIGAIIGLEKENNIYLEEMNKGKAYIGLRVLKPIRKIRLAENLIHTKLAKGLGMNLITKRTQIGFEFLKDPCYRIYFYHTDNKIYNLLKENLKSHKSVYTPYLGISELIANFKFVDELEIKVQNSKEHIFINSVLSLNDILKKDAIKFRREDEYILIRLPSELNKERVVIEYKDFIIEKNGKPIEVKLKEEFIQVLYKDGEQENIVFL